MSNVKIAVVISTYNGSKYVTEQLSSIINQSLKPSWIVVRDDVSSDNTIEIVKQIVGKDLIFVPSMQNLGPTQSFLACLKYVPEAATHVAFSDQDDVWDPKKLERAITKLESTHSEKTPSLYCSEYLFCDQDLNIQGPSHLNAVEVTFQRLLYENHCSGNTMVFNRPLLDLINKSCFLNIYIHDWWTALLASATGTLVYDNWPCLKYRRTGNNASPTGKVGLKLLKKRFDLFFKSGKLKLITQQLQELYDNFGSFLSPENRAILQTFLFGGAFKKAFYPHRLRQQLSAEILLRILFLLRLL